MTTITRKEWLRLVEENPCGFASMRQTQDFDARHIWRGVRSAKEYREMAAIEGVPGFTASIHIDDEVREYLVIA